MADDGLLTDSGATVWSPGGVQYIPVPGPDGPPGPPNVLTIGTVEEGLSPDVTIIGDSPNQVLNFVLQKGNQGNPGVPGQNSSLTIGTVEAVPSSDPAEATITGTPPNQVLNLKIPRGLQVEFTTLYPGGNSSVPGTLNIATRTVVNSPFPGRALQALVQIKIGNDWYEPGWYTDYFSAASRSMGARASIVNNSDDSSAWVVVQSGTVGVYVDSIISGGGSASTSPLTSAPFRIQVWGTPKA